jgi:hypothetical protein
VAIECAHNDLKFLRKKIHKTKSNFFKVLFSFWCNFKAKGNIILHFGVDKMIQGSFPNDTQPVAELNILCLAYPAIAGKTGMKMISA